MASADPRIAPESNLSGYLQEIRKFAMLSEEEEVTFARRWRDETGRGSCS